MFYVPYKGQALERLMVLIGMHREDILSGNIPVFVEGFCPDRKTARERSNRVKSEMILRGGLHEACFRTVNHVQEGDYVEVRLRENIKDIRLRSRRMMQTRFPKRRICPMT